MRELDGPLLIDLYKPSLLEEVDVVEEALEVLDEAGARHKTRTLTPGDASFQDRAPVGIELVEGFVQDDVPGLRDICQCQGQTLLLSTGQQCALTLTVALEAPVGQGLADRLLHGLRRPAQGLERSGELILQTRRQEVVRWILGNEAEAVHHFMGRTERLSVKEDAAAQAARVVHRGDGRGDAAQRRLAAAGLAQDEDCTATWHFKVQIREEGRRDDAPALAFVAE